MIDKNGKLFGKINIIDLLIVLIVIAAAAFVALRVLGGGESGESAGENRVRITFYTDWAYDFVADSISIGDPVSEHSFLTDLGTVTSFESEPAYELVYDEVRGEFIKQEKPGYSFLTVTCETTGFMGPTGFTKGTTRFVVGGGYYFNVGPTRAGFQIKSFEVLD